MIIRAMRVSEEPANLSAEDAEQRRVKENLHRFECLFGTDEDAFEQPTTTRKELWSYYLYYNGKFTAIPADSNLTKI